MKKLFALAGIVLMALSGCRSYEAKPIVWEDEEKKTGIAGATNEITFASLDEAVRVALVGNP